MHELLMKRSTLPASQGCRFLFLALALVILLCTVVALGIDAQGDPMPNPGTALALTQIVAPTSTPGMATHIVTTLQAQQSATAIIATPLIVTVTPLPNPDEPLYVAPYIPLEVIVIPSESLTLTTPLIVIPACECQVSWSINLRSWIDAILRVSQLFVSLK